LIVIGAPRGARHDVQTITGLLDGLDHQAIIELADFDGIP
jgi:hypothetical protein